MTPGQATHVKKRKYSGADEEKWHSLMTYLFPDFVVDGISSIRKHFSLCEYRETTLCHVVSLQTTDSYYLQTTNPLADMSRPYRISRCR